MADTMTTPSDAEINELVSHVMALRNDFIRELLRRANTAASDRAGPKAELRQLLRNAIARGRLTVDQVIEFLDETEPGGKQHVFLLRVPRKVNDTWKDLTAARRRLARLKDVRPLLRGSVPLLMPEEFTLSSVHFNDQGVEIVGVEARRYFERDESLDEEGQSEEGLPVELRAYVERVARSTVTLRWDVTTRHAALHVTQATGRGLERDHYRRVARRFAAATAPWLDFGAFRDVDLHKAIHELQRREQVGNAALTRSRRGRWETVDGSELEAISSSTQESVFRDTKMASAIGQVADADSGQTGNMYWLSDGPIGDPLHITIIAADSRVHFMRPSSPEAVEHVVAEIRRLL